MDNSCQAKRIGNQQAEGAACAKYGCSYKFVVTVRAIYGMLLVSHPVPVDPFIAVGSHPPSLLGAMCFLVKTWTYNSDDLLWVLAPPHSQ